MKTQEEYDKEFMRIAMAVLKRTCKFHPQRLAHAAKLLRIHKENNLKN
jgi:hypothetical protein